MPKICIIYLVFKFISLRYDAIFHLLYFVNAVCSVLRTELLVISFLILYTYSYILLFPLIKSCDRLTRNLNIKIILCIRTFRREIFATTSHLFPAVAMNFLLTIACTGFTNHYNTLQQKHNNII